VAVLSWEQVAAVALKAGWPAGPAVIAVAITEPESSRDASVVQAGQPYATTGWGLWQITPGNSVPQFGVNGQLLNPLNNAKAGHYKWAQAGGFGPWTTYMNGLEQPFIPAAEAAVRLVTGLSPAALGKLVAAAIAAAPGGPAGGGTVSDWSPMVRKSASHGRRMAARSHDTAKVITAMRPGTVHPVVTVPAPGRVLWTPGEPMPT
jgi:hypothetical protein